MDRASFARQLEKGFDTPYAGGELSPSISPVHQLTSETEHPEYRYLRLERLCSGFSIDAAVVGQRSQVGLRNPAGSGALIILRELVMIAFAAAREYRVFVGTGAVIDGEATQFIRDLRYGPTTTVKSTGRVFLRTNAAPVQGQAIQRYRVGVETCLIAPLDVVLPPNGFVLVSPDADNVPCDAGFNWTERVAEPGELQGAGV